MSNIRLSHLVISLALLAAILLALVPTAPAFALSGAVGASRSGTAAITAGTVSASPAAVSCRTFVKNRHETLEHRGNLTIVHVSETIVTECNGRVVSERHVSYTYIRR